MLWIYRVKQWKNHIILKKLQVIILSNNEPTFQRQYVVDSNEKKSKCSNVDMVVEEELETDYPNNEFVINMM